MKDEQITKLVSKWQTRLKLAHWDVKLEILDHDNFIDGVTGDVTYDYKYLNATIRLARNLSGGVLMSRAKLTHNAIHELLHLHLVGLNIANETPEHTVEEQAIQILSRVILEGYEK